MYMYMYMHMYMYMYMCMYMCMCVGMWSHVFCEGVVKQCSVVNCGQYTKRNLLSHVSLTCNLSECVLGSLCERVWCGVDLYDVCNDICILYGAYCTSHIDLCDICLLHDICHTYAIICAYCISHIDLHDICLLYDICHTYPMICAYCISHIHLHRTYVYMMYANHMHMFAKISINHTWMDIWQKYRIQNSLTVCWYTPYTSPYCSILSDHNCLHVNMDTSIWIRQ